MVFKVCKGVPGRIYRFYYFYCLIQRIHAASARAVAWPIPLLVQVPVPVPVPVTRATVPVSGDVMSVSFANQSENRASRVIVSKRERQLPVGVSLCQ